MRRAMEMALWLIIAAMFIGGLSLIFQKPDK